MIYVDVIAYDDHTRQRTDLPLIIRLWTTPTRKANMMIYAQSRKANVMIYAQARKANVIIYAQARVRQG